jgi:hypothetical protein
MSATCNRLTKPSIGKPGNDIASPREAPGGAARALPLGTNPRSRHARGYARERFELFFAERFLLAVFADFALDAFSLPVSCATRSSWLRIWGCRGAVCHTSNVLARGSSLRSSPSWFGLTEAGLYQRARHSAFVSSSFSRETRVEDRRSAAQRYTMHLSSPTVAALSHDGLPLPIDGRCSGSGRDRSGAKRTSI